MGAETLARNPLSLPKNAKSQHFDLPTLLDAHLQSRLSDRIEFPDHELSLLYKHYVENHLHDEKVYEIFAACFMERGMWKKARSSLYSRLYLLENESEDHEKTLKLLSKVEESMLSEALHLPRLHLEKLFLRENTSNLTTWRSRMHYTSVLKADAYRTLERGPSLISVSTTPLKPGDLILKTAPLAVSPWSFKSYSEGASPQKRSTYCCFHCLSVINKSFEALREDNRLIACSKHPRECSYYFCSRECFLKNAAVHSQECEQLIKLQKFAEYYLNPALVLMVCRVLIKCSLTMEGTNRVCEVNFDPNFSNSFLDSILNFELDYALLNLYHRETLEHVDRFASFLMESLGFDFCLHLTKHELVHMTLVIWLNSIPVTSYLDYSVESDEDNAMGGVVFSFKLLEFKRSHTPNCTLHLDDEGKLNVRSIYEVQTGCELTVNTFMDKYSPPFLQSRKFWSVSSLFFLDVSNPQALDIFRDLASIRCKNCLDFCYAKNFLNPLGSRAQGFESAPVLRRYNWECSGCKSFSTKDLDLLHNKAEALFLKAQKLYFAGDFVHAKNRLLELVNNWSGVLHPGHYLMYNAYLLLSGILMNKPGGNVMDSIVYLRKALLVADQVLPRVCHERAYLYDRLAHYLLKMKSYLRLKNEDYINLKELIMNALYNALWNWTVISGTGSYQSLLAMQKCRRVAFSMNVHTFPLSRDFVVNIPNKYAHVFRAATGYKVVPKSFSTNLASDSANEPSLTGLTDSCPVDDVASMAFRAAQSGEFDDVVLDVLTTVQSYGIAHLGTGLSVIGLVASNFYLEFFTALMGSVHQRLVKLLQSLSDSPGTNEEAEWVETQVFNLLYSVCGPNELGIDAVSFSVSTPYPVDNPSEDELGLWVNTERTIANIIFTFSLKVKDLLHEYSQRVRQGSVSPDFQRLLSSDFDFTSHLVNRTTHSMLGSQTPLHYASSRGKTEMVGYFVKHGASVNTLNLEGASPLHLAALNGHERLVKLLVDLNSKTNVTLRNGETPLHLAVYGLHSKTVESLIGLFKEHDFEEMSSPSLWHALVSGIFRPDQESPSGFRKERTKPIETVVARLSKALEISKILLRPESVVCGKTYVWANRLPSQLLQELWDTTFDGDSLFSFPKRPPSVYVASNVNGVMERPLRTLCTPETAGEVGLYGHLSDTTYEVNNYSDLNENNDAIFSATRTFHFLVEILRGLENQSPDSTTH